MGYFLFLAGMGINDPSLNETEFFEKCAECIDLGACFAFE